jgi:hypothetical protein
MLWGQGTGIKNSSPVRANTKQQYEIKALTIRLNFSLKLLNTIEQLQKH